MTETRPPHAQPFLDPRSKAGIGQIIGFAVLIGGSIASQSAIADPRPFLLAGGLTLGASTLIRFWPTWRVAKDGH